MPVSEHCAVDGKKILEYPGGELTLSRYPFTPAGTAVLYTSLAANKDCGAGTPLASASERLCDDLPEVGNDERYLADIRDTSGEADCLLFVTELDASRVSSDERRGIKMLTEALGASVWEDALIVFTRADKVGADDLETHLKERMSLLREAIAAYAPLQAAFIPALAVSNTSNTLPNGKPWLSELFTQVLTRLRHDATVPFLNWMREDVGIDPVASTNEGNRFLSGVVSFGFAGRHNPVRVQQHGAGHGKAGIAKFEGSRLA